MRMHAPQGRQQAVRLPCRRPCPAGAGAAAAVRLARGRRASRRRLRAAAPGGHASERPGSGAVMGALLCTFVLGSWQGAPVGDLSLAASVLLPRWCHTTSAGAITAATAQLVGSHSRLPLSPSALPLVALVPRSAGPSQASLDNYLAPASHQASAAATPSKSTGTAAGRGGRGRGARGAGTKRGRKVGVGLTRAVLGRSTAHVRVWGGQAVYAARQLLVVNLVSDPFHGCCPHPGRK